MGPEQRAGTFREYYERWDAARQISAIKGHTDDFRAKLHVRRIGGVADRGYPPDRHR